MNYNLDSLRELIKLKSNELDEYKSALKVMEKLVGQNVFGADVAKQDSSVINLNDLDVPAIVPSTQTTLLDDIRSIISRLGEQQFTVNHIEAALKDAGRDTSTKSFKNRVSMLLKRLLEAEEIERLIAGKGNKPATYRNIIKS
jgi:hypothetical protein